MNARAVELAARLGFALGAHVQSRSSFDRKHYRYPDLPHGYQITQQRSPIALGGSLDVFVDKKAVGGVGGADDGSKRRTLRVERLQLEMDTGKSSVASDGATTVDLNRAGSTLVEIVTAPDLRGAEEAASAAETFQRVVRFLGVGDANMEEGSMRVDVNVSHRTRDGAVVGERCEVKNLNSFRSIARAVAHERTRQIALLKRGTGVRRQTRSFDPATGATAVLRDKEALLDYRFAPEPDLPPVVIEPAALRAIEAAVPELPSSAAARLTRTRGLTPKLARTIASRGPWTVAYFDACSETADAWSTRHGTAAPAADDVANWVTGVLVGAVKRAGVGARKGKGGSGGEPLRGLPESAGAARVGELLARVAAEVKGNGQSERLSRGWRLSVGGRRHPGPRGWRGSRSREGAGGHARLWSSSPGGRTRSWARRTKGGRDRKPRGRSRRTSSSACTNFPRLFPGNDTRRVSAAPDPECRSRQRDGRAAT